MALIFHVVDLNGPASREAVTHLIRGKRARIGRSPDSDIVLRDPEAYISNHHATVERRGDRWVLIDNSTNGVYVDDAPQPAPAGSEIVLKDRLRLRIGHYALTVSLTS